jgi:hypothetical protein
MAPILPDDPKVRQRKNRLVERIRGRITTPRHPIAGSPTHSGDHYPKPLTPCAALGARIQCSRDRRARPAVQGGARRATCRDAKGSCASAPPAGDTAPSYVLLGAVHGSPAGVPGAPRAAALDRKQRPTIPPAQPDCSLLVDVMSPIIRVSLRSG